MTQIPHYTRLIIGAITAISFTAGLSNQAVGQGSRLERYLERSDLNNDGILEPNEMTNSIKSYLKSKGHSTDSKIKISQILSGSPKKQQPASPRSVDLKVPKFGVEDSEKTGLQTFAPATETIQYSENVMSKAQKTLKRYDRNENNFLEADEISNGSWGSPEPYAYDKDGDRRLSLAELQARYHDRNTISKKSKQLTEDSSKVDRSDSGESNGRTTNGPARQMFSGRRALAASQSSASDRSRKSVTTQKSVSKKSTTSKSNDYANYVTKYIEGRDTNKNGMIDGDELDKVRSPTKYDTNNDGKIERHEMLAVFTKSSTGTTSSSKTSSSRTSRSRNSNSRSNEKTSSPFENIDTNNDRLVQMHEFSKKWTKKKFDEFIAKDANGDGVISPEEW